MRTCDVLDCPSAANLVMQMTPPGQALLKAWLCHAHYDAIDRGDRWLGDWAGRFGEGAAALLMGRDLPPLVRNYTCTRGHFSNGGQTEVINLELVHSDGSVTHLEFELHPDARRSLAVWLGDESPSPERAADIS